jgi:WD40 repeat protein
MPSVVKTTQPYGTPVWDEQLDWVVGMAVVDPAAAPIFLTGHEGETSAVAISHDNRWLGTGSKDATAQLWNQHLDELVGLACSMAGRNLTAEEREQYSRGKVRF